MWILCSDWWLRECSYHLGMRDRLYTRWLEAIRLARVVRLWSNHTWKCRNRVLCLQRNVTCGSSLELLKSRNRFAWRACRVRRLSSRRLSASCNTCWSTWSNAWCSSSVESSCSLQFPKRIQSSDCTQSSHLRHMELSARETCQFQLTLR